MAKVTKSVKVENKQKIIVERVETPVYNLELTGPEMATLRIMCEFVSGNPYDSPRKHCNSIKNAIDEHSNKFYGESSRFLELLLEFRGIHFKDSALNYTDTFK